MTATAQSPPAHIKSVIWLTLLWATLCLAGGVFIIATGDGHLVRGARLSETAAEMILLLVSLVVTLCSDTLGFVHATSLRWALYHERRLEYNTNFRLFTSARATLANRWYMNLVSAASLVLAYSSSSALLLRGSYSSDADLAVNGMALVLLGLGGLGQTATAALCWRRHETRIPSWSPNPLWNTVTCLKGSGLVEHRPGRCMQSVADRHKEAQPTRPRHSQPRLWSIRATRWIVVAVWALSVVSFIWAGIIIYIPTLMFSHNPFVFRWDTDPGDTYSNVIFGMDPSTNDPQVDVTFPPGLQFFLGILFLFFVQGLQAVGLHCIELLVNMSRDEDVWRSAVRPKGTSPYSTGPFLAALSSWRTVLLSALKVVQHWLLGQSMVPHYHLDEPGPYSQFTFNMSSSRLLVFACVSAVAALFTTLLACWPVRGPQPAAWGHLQTLGDLIDEWNAPQGRLWWGDKGEIDGVRHAGTAGSRHEVGRIHQDVLYAGREIFLDLQ